MKPQWFKINELPFADMWPDDIYWLPKVLGGELIAGAFSFGEGDTILDQEVSTADKDSLY